MTATMTHPVITRPAAASMAADALAATERIRRASPYVQAMVLADFAALHPVEALDMLEEAEHAQESIADVWINEDIAEPGPGMWPETATPQAPDAITEARAAMETARAELSAAMDLPIPDAEALELLDRFHAAQEGWQVALAARYAR